MKKAKKKRVGDAEVPQLLSGVFKIISNDLSVKHAVCCSTDRINQLKKTINLYGLKNGFFIVRQFHI